MEPPGNSGSLGVSAEQEMGVRAHCGSRDLLSGATCNAELCVMISPHQDSRLHNKTLKRTRKFVVDGVEVSITTSKIISEDEKKDEEMRFLRQAWAGPLMAVTGRVW